MHNASVNEVLCFLLGLTDLRNKETMPESNAVVLFLSKCGALNINKARGGEEEMVSETHIFQN